ncbi:MAG: hypothetical protein DHS20C18_19220 [Saprospiraceae bacterium]|nr:MAG: hypothetical protein DHS20C18_19220 [Saprospiraceae bacterium]
MLHHNTSNHQTTSSFKVENILLILLLCIGICGFLYTYNYSSSPKNEIIWGQMGKTNNLSQVIEETGEQSDRETIEIQVGNPVAGR